MQKRLLPGLLAVGLGALFVLSPRAFSQSVYSYVDEKGVRTFTNIPPKNGVALEWKNGSSVPAPAAQGNPPARTAPRVSLYDPIIEKYASQYRLDPSLVRSMIRTESGFNAKAVSSKGARGLMQLMPATATSVGVRNIFDPDENIRGGMKHMRTLLDRFSDDLVLSLAAYNAGENLVERIGRVPNIRETHNYIRSITMQYGKKKMDLPLELSAPNAPSTFRYRDKNGVLHLTNIPPVVRPADYTWAVSGQSR